MTVSTPTLRAVARPAGSTVTTPDRADQSTGPSGTVSPPASTVAASSWTLSFGCSAAQDGLITRSDGSGGGRSGSKIARQAATPRHRTAQANRLRNLRAPDSMRQTIGNPYINPFLYSRFPCQPLVPSHGEPPCPGPFHAF